MTHKYMTSTQNLKIKSKDIKSILKSSRQARQKANQLLEDQSTVQTAAQVSGVIGKILVAYSQKPQAIIKQLNFS